MKQADKVEFADMRALAPRPRSPQPSPVPGGSVSARPGATPAPKPDPAPPARPLIRPAATTQPSRPAVKPAPATVVKRASLQAVMRSLFLAGWDGKTQPTFLAEGALLALANWRVASGQVLPIFKESPFPLPRDWRVWIANERTDITDRTLTCALAVAAHGYLRGRAGVKRVTGSSPDAPPLEVTAALTVLREVVDCLDRKLAPSAATLEVWDDHDAGEAALQRRAPSASTRASWARDARLARFAKWQRAKMDMSAASMRHVELDVKGMIEALGLTPTRAEVDGWLRGQKQARRLRCAWKQYVEHCIAKQDRARPSHATAGPTGRPSLSNMEMPPPEACAAIKVLATKFTGTGLHKLRVSDYRGERGERAMMVTTSRGRTPVKLSTEEHVAVQTVRGWAANGGEAALVPRKPGETGAMSLAGLKLVTSTMGAKH